MVRRLETSPAASKDRALKRRSRRGMTACIATVVTISANVSTPAANRPPCREAMYGTADSSR